MFKKFIAFYGTQRYITCFRKPQEFFLLSRLYPVSNVFKLGFLSHVLFSCFQIKCAFRHVLCTYCILHSSNAHWIFYPSRILWVNQRLASRYWRLFPRSIANGKRIWPHLSSSQNAWSSSSFSVYRSISCIGSNLPVLLRVMKLFILSFSPVFCYFLLCRIWVSSLAVYFIS